MSDLQGARSARIQGINDERKKRILRSEPSGCKQAFYDALAEDDAQGENGEGDKMKDDYEYFKKQDKKRFEKLIGKERREYKIVYAFLVFEDTYNVIIETTRGEYETWSYSMNSDKIKMPAKWRQVDHGCEEVPVYKG